MFIYFIISVIAMICFFYFLIKNAGRTCADCKNLHKCWKKIDEYTYDNPACSYFQERESEQK